MSDLKNRFDEYSDDNNSHLNETYFEKLEILLIDDTKINLFVTDKLITRFLPNVIIYKAQSGEEGIEIFKNQKGINAVLLDIYMPEMNGFETAKKIRSISNNTNLLIAALTVDNSEEGIEKIMDSGINSRISKPVTKMEIINLLKNHQLIK